MRDAVGVPVLLFRYMVNEGTVTMDGGHHNPVVSFVDDIIGGVAQRESAGLSPLTETEKRQAVKQVLHT